MFLRNICTVTLRNVALNEKKKKTSKLTDDIDTAENFRDSLNHQDNSTKALWENASTVF